MIPKAMKEWGNKNS